MESSVISLSNGTRFYRNELEEKEDAFIITSEDILLKFPPREFQDLAQLRWEILFQLVG